MEKRLGTVIILVSEGADTGKLNSIISQHGDMVLGRQGIPMRDRGLNVISLVLEGTTDEIGALTGKIGRMEGIRVKSVLAS
ncbi:MAG: TM1266 family iron-only hydrogenase system putative regulator [Bacteroidota bacterium]